MTPTHPPSHFQKGYGATDLVCAFPCWCFIAIDLRNCANLSFAWCLSPVITGISVLNQMARYLIKLASNRLDMFGGVYSVDIKDMADLNNAVI